MSKGSTAANKLIWTLAFAVFISMAVAFMRKWKSRPATVATHPELHDVGIDSFRERVRLETEKDD